MAVCFSRAHCLAKIYTYMHTFNLLIFNDSLSSARFEILIIGILPMVDLASALLPKTNLDFK